MTGIVVGGTRLINEFGVDRLQKRLGTLACVSAMMHNNDVWMGSTKLKFDKFGNHPLVGDQTVQEFFVSLRQSRYNDRDYKK